MPTIRHAEEVGLCCGILQLVREVDVASGYRGFDLRCFEDPIDGLSMVKDEDACCSELVHEGQKRHHLRGPRFVEWQMLDNVCFSP